VDPAVKGTQTILETCSRCNIKRLVITSSEGAVIGCAGPKNGKEWTEDDWNRDARLDYSPYAFSKTQAEKQAWKFMEENKKLCFDLITINPPAIWGPPLNNTINKSLEAISTPLEAPFPLLPNVWLSGVDVRDVASAHVFLMTNPKAQGRYLISNGVTNTAQITEILSNRYPTLWMPKWIMPVWLFRLLPLVDSRVDKWTVDQYSHEVVPMSSKKLLSTGFTFKYTLKQSMLETAHSLLERKMVKTKPLQVVRLLTLIGILVVVLLIFFIFF